jgi:hypothetical protein
LAMQRGVRPSEVAHERYLASQLLRAGSRRGAASIFAALAFKHKRWRELPRVAAALCAPRLTARLGKARAAAAVPAAWQAEAEAWLRPLRDTNERRLVDHRARREHVRFGLPIQ